jgi:cell division protein ZapA (FtsZ GTPase activity inhibitor)
MSAEPLAVYLDDHLAGSVAALNLMEELADLTRGRPLEAKLRTLHAEVSQEQQQLRELLARLAEHPNPIKQATAWISEKLGEGKLALSARAHPELATLQGLESLGLGLQGKLSLYRALADLAPRDPRLQGDFSGLAERTVVQQAMLENERIAAVRAAFAAAGQPS